MLASTALGELLFQSFSSLWESVQFICRGFYKDPCHCVSGGDRKITFGAGTLLMVLPSKFSRKGSVSAFVFTQKECFVTSQIQWVPICATPEYSAELDTEMSLCSAPGDQLPDWAGMMNPDSSGASQQYKQTGQLQVSVKFCFAIAISMRLSVKEFVFKSPVPGFYTQANIWQSAQTFSGAVTHFLPIHRFWQC